MSIKNRIKRMEKQNNLSASCLCAISDLPDLLTAQTLAPVCEQCGGQRTAKAIENFAERTNEGQARLSVITEQVRLRNE